MSKAGPDDWARCYGKEQGHDANASLLMEAEASTQGPAEASALQARQLELLNRAGKEGAADEAGAAAQKAGKPPCGPGKTCVKIMGPWENDVFSCVEDEQ